MINMFAGKTGERPRLVELKEKCAKQCEMSTQELLLLAGEMSAQELRSVKAVLAYVARQIRAL